METEGDVLADASQGAVPAPPRPTSRKEKSLGVLSQRFVQLFLLAGQTAVSLENAAIQLLGRSPSDSDPFVSPADGDASKLLKTKVRRLYDIANILSSLNLIEKVHTSNRKPAFKWLGPEASLSAVHALRADGLKRPSSTVVDEGRAPATVKRRKVFAGADGRGDRPAVTVDARTASVSPVTDAGCYEGENGFDCETMRKIDSVLSTFPSNYETRWRTYVESVNQMLLRGQVSRDKAYESVSSVLEQYHGGIADGATDGASCERRANGSADAKRDGADERVCADGVTPIGEGKVDDGYASVLRKESGVRQSEQDGAGDEQVPQATTVADAECNKTCKDETAVVGNLERRNAEPKPDNTDSNSGGASKHHASEQAKVEGTERKDNKETVTCESRATEKVGTGGVESGIPQVVGKTPWSEEYIAEYMEKARVAGPQYEAAARDWLKAFRDWQKTWSRTAGPYQALPQAQQAHGGGRAVGVDDSVTGGATKKEDVTVT